MGVTTRIKICCISSIEEARLAVACGAAAIGLVSAMPSGPGVIDETRIAAIAAVVPPAVGTFLLTAGQEPEAVIDQQRRCGCNTLQLVDTFPIDGYSVLRKALPGVRIVQVIHVTGGEAVDEARRVAPYVDGLLLDSGNPRLAVKELGGTGRTHNWAISRAIVESVRKPVFLAGGLNAENVGSALKQVMPFGVDVCSGVRTNGELDPDKLQRFVALVTGRTAAPA
ncbi:MAG: phosphoribosylanthranilate isomerase [Caldilineaceae bacterium]|nr:phosphoribosylanthranilate isomerase [Caldilineaceae bacterium]